jgi:hypothetical protein
MIYIRGTAHNRFNLITFVEFTEFYTANREFRHFQYTSTITLIGQSTQPSGFRVLLHMLEDKGIVHIHTRAVLKVCSNVYTMG